MQSHDIFTILGTGVFSLMVFFFKLWVEKKRLKAALKKIDPVAESLKNNVLVANKLDEIKDTYNADRIWITQFHNGGNFYPTGKSIHKFSMCYEYLSSHTYSIQDRFQNIPVSLFSRSINYLLDNNIIQIPDYQHRRDDIQYIKYITEETSCESSYAFAIKTIDDKFIGILGIDYTEGKRILTPEDITDITLGASSIGGILMVQLSKKP